MSTYKFDPSFDAVSEIRLLTIVPGSTQDPVACKLKIHQVDFLPSFEALSYTRGYNNAQNPIDIDGDRFIVHGNVYQALLELRKPKAYRTFWIDAICVDQQDEYEKKRQVRLMKSIYSKAERVVVWFPPPRGTTDQIIGLIRELHLWGWETAKSIIEDKEWHRLKAADWIALRDFLAHPWWSRVWTLQEVVLAREIVLQLGTQIEWMRGLLRSGKELSLLDLLLHCWERKATDTRDCIYGLFALSSDIDAGVLDLEINYNAAVAEVLTGAVNEVLLKHGTLELFSNAGVGFPRTLKGLPSYVPDWSNINIAAKPLYYLFDEGRQTLTLQEKGVRLHSSGQLQVSVYFLENVAEVSSEPLTGMKGAQDNEKCLAWLTEVERMTKYGSVRTQGARDPYTPIPPLKGSMSVFEAFWRTLVANRSIRWFQPPPFVLHAYLGYKNGLSKACGGRPVTTPFTNADEEALRYPVPPEDLAVLEKDWIDTMRITTYGRSFCLTNDGRIGLVPPGTKPGDHICLLEGGAVPYVMRPYIAPNLPGPQKEPSFQLVGECYIHGVGAFQIIEAYRPAHTVLLV
ncbi:uncharacterized protein N0V89_000190 [Didymosphaeria variabile]|uniref:Heterokaryon incompatibility domain-containing protein n=1 Tax=Didymosphaeria variabile TaxID=1932322 RepID=A0A9W8XVN7_9PLEO|nr:uncharacterized protein N0V89_000190 [Didymosphaeria variabile]KAJ4359635.1 hypothetical protein N0V89_000190 [Didymosphaeria variabile]